MDGTFVARSKALCFRLRREIGGKANSPGGELIRDR